MSKRSRKKPLQNGAQMQSSEDALGSYTGVAYGDCYDSPVQDADDL